MPAKAARCATAAAPVDHACRGSIALATAAQVLDQQQHADPFVAAHAEWQAARDEESRLGKAYGDLTDGKPRCVDALGPEITLDVPGERIRLITIKPDNVDVLLSAYASDYSPAATERVRAFLFEELRLREIERLATYTPDMEQASTAFCDAGERADALEKGLINVTPTTVQGIALKCDFLVKRLTGSGPATSPSVIHSLGMLASAAKRMAASVEA